MPQVDRVGVGPKNWLAIDASRVVGYKREVAATQITSAVPTTGRAAW